MSIFDRVNHPARGRQGGDNVARDAAWISRDLAHGYISAGACIRDHDLSEAEIESVLEAVRRGEKKA